MELGTDEANPWGGSRDANRAFPCAVYPISRGEIHEPPGTSTIEFPRGGRPGVERLSFRCAGAGEAGRRVAEDDSPRRGRNISRRAARREPRRNEAARA